MGLVVMPGMFIVSYIVIYIIVHMYAGAHNHVCTHYALFNNNNNTFIWNSATSIIVCDTSQHITI